MAQQEGRGLTCRTAERHDVNLPDVIPVAFGTGGGWETHQRSRQLSAGLQDLHQGAMPRFWPRPGDRGSRSATRSSVGDGMTPPKVLETPRPVSSVMISRMFGAPLGGTTRAGQYGFDCSTFRSILP